MTNPVDSLIDDAFSKVNAAHAEATTQAVERAIDLTEAAMLRKIEANGFAIAHGFTPEDIKQIVFGLRWAAADNDSKLEQAQIWRALAERLSA